MSDSTELLGTTMENERTKDGVSNAVSEPVDGDVIWNVGEPPPGILLSLKCDDFMGEYTMKAKRVDYKKPMLGKNNKSFREGWRWIKENGETLTRKEAPSAWAYL